MTPELARLLQDPARVTEVPPEAIPGLLGQLEQLKVELWARMMSAAANDGQPEAPAKEPDRWLTVEEAGAIANLPPTWFYRRRNLPFVRRLSRRCLRVSKAGLHKWLAARKG